MVSPPTSSQQTTDRWLTLDGVLADLVADKLVSREDADKLIGDRRVNRGTAHPLVVIADQKFKDPRHPRKALHLEVLTEWLAEKVDLPYLHIDPFKIDFAAVTKLMSTAYAQRFRILPVSVTTREATIATCEPFVREWEEQLGQILRVGIKRVIVNPLDIQGYIVEFFNLARSVKGATENKIMQRLKTLRAEEKISWDQIALLFRASTGFPEYEQALEWAGIPFVTVAGKGFYDRPEIRDVLNILRALADPWDDLALAARDP
jgi:hypothetical protein